MSMNMNNMMIRPRLVGLRIGLGTGRTSSGWGAAGVSTGGLRSGLGWPRQRRYIYLETNPKIAMTDEQI